LLENVSDFPTTVKADFPCEPQTEMAHVMRQPFMAIEYDSRIKQGEGQVADLCPNRQHYPRAIVQNELVLKS
jgi:hypothetical protein